MTQEELDALMDGDLDEEMTLLEEAPKSPQESNNEPIKDDNGLLIIDEDNFKMNAASSWPPPPPTEDHQIVNQLDDVTKDSEKKATEIFDKLEEISTYVMDIEAEANETLTVVEKNIEIFEKLHHSFPNIEAFSASLESNQNINDKINTIVEKSQYGADEIMMIMDIMQYQDIHRQKIERVINVMRALTNYMNSLFETTVQDDKRVSSAVHIEGDSATTDLVHNDEIEALLASFGQK